MTLCVIDMQDGFESSADCLEQVIEEVQAAMEQNEHIILVEYAGYGRTSEKITDVLKDYSQQISTTKSMDGGGEEMLCALKRVGFCVETLRFCGVNTCYCVYSTIYDTWEIEPTANISLLAEATACTCHKYGNNHNDPGIHNCAVKYQNNQPQIDIVGM